MSRPFKSDLVIQEYICEPTLKAYHIGFDQKQFRLPQIRNRPHKMTQRSKR